MNFVTKIWTSLKWFIVTCLSDGGTVSFGRTLSAFWSVYFATLDYHFFLVNSHKMIDNATLLTHLTVVTSSYGITKAKDALDSLKGNNGQA